MTETRNTRVLIIGAGPAGYTAAIYAARASLAPIMVAGLQPGGQLTITTDVENYPGFADAIQGPWLMEQMEKQAAHVGTEIIYDIVTKVDLSGAPFRAWTDGGLEIAADSVIIATGAQARWLGLPSEAHYQGAGVSACATCDGFFYRGKKVVVVGGGNTAVEEALYLTHHASHVTLVHRRDKFRAERILQDRLFNNPKISVIWDHAVEEITGGGTPAVVTGISLRNVKTGAIQSVETDGVFIAIGHSPTTAIFHGQINTDTEGYIITAPGTTETNIPGVFAAGDVQDKIFRQAVTAAGTGCMAALEAEKFLAHIPLRVDDATQWNRRPEAMTGQKMDWDKLRVFHAVAEAGSFTHAGDTLNLSQSAVSRQISALEEALSVPLFHRHARGLILTEQGEALNRTVREVFAKLAMTEALLAESKEKPAGRLKVTTTHSFGVTWLAPRLKTFLGAHPDVTLSLLLDDTELDLAMREADVAIRMHPPRQPDLVQRHLGQIRSQIWAAPDYLKAHGTPEKVEDLDNHKLILFGDRRPPVVDINWLAELGRRDGMPRRGVMEVNSLQAMLVCIRAGLGIGAVPDYLVQDHAGLVAVLPEVKKPTIDMYFVYPEELRNSKRVSVFRDFLVTALAERNPKSEPS